MILDVIRRHAFIVSIGANIGRVTGHPLQSNASNRTRLYIPLDTGKRT